MVRRQLILGLAAGIFILLWGLVACTNPLANAVQSLVAAGGGTNGGGDNAPPSAPTISSAAPGQEQVTVTWSAVTGATSYNLYWAVGSTVSITSGTKVSNANSPQTVGSLTNGTLYAFILTAVNNSGESAPSAVVTATPSATGSPPLAPTIIGAAPGNGQVTVTWSAVTGATSYNLYWTAGSTVSTTNGTKISDASSPQTVGSLTNGTLYAFTVTAVNSYGESSTSSVATATPSVTGTPPLAPTISDAVPGDGQVIITWPTVSGATSYNLYWAQGTTVSTSTGTKVYSAISPQTVSGLTNGTQYAFIVTADNSYGEGAPSTVVTATLAIPVNWNKANLGFLTYSIEKITVGNGRGDGTNRVYVGGGSDSTGQIYEYTFNTDHWDSLYIPGSGDNFGLGTVFGMAIGDVRHSGHPALYAAGYPFEFYYSGGTWTRTDADPSSTIQWANSLKIGSGRNDGYSYLYLAGWNAIYETQYGGGTWPITSPNGYTISTGTAVQDLVIAAARNDGVSRLYASIGSGYASVYEYAWDSIGKKWDATSQCGTPPQYTSMQYICAGNGRNDGNQRLYLANYWPGIYELSFDGVNWSYTTISTTAKATGLIIADGRSDGTMRLYAAESSGVGEYTYTSSMWSRTSTLSLGSSVAANDVAEGNGRNDGKTRIYATGSDKDIYEFTAP